MDKQLEVLIELSEALVKRWKPRLGTDRLDLMPSVARLIGGLEQILLSDLTLADDFAAATAAKNIDLNEVEEAIARFQRLAGISHTDGILGNKTLSALATTSVCMGCTLPVDNEPVSQSIALRAESDDRFWFFYFIDKLPVVPGGDALQLVRKAWQSWSSSTNMGVDQVSDRALANIFITTRNFSGITLADANPGPPRERVLHLRIDSTRTWNPALFEATVCHEIGHLLGINRHLSTGTGFLMSTNLDGSIRKPTPTDIQAAARMVGTRPQPGPIVPEPEIPEFPT